MGKINILPGLTNALKGISGEFELVRSVGAFGVTAYILGANAFVAWNMANGEKFDVTAYCLAFPGGLAVAYGAIAGAAAYKDRGVATAQVIRDTGAVPTPPPAGPPVPVEPQP